MPKFLQKTTMLVLTLIFTTANAFAVEYNDLTKEHWAYPQITQLSEEKVVVGYPDGTFRPNDYITRAEYATMAINALHQENAELTDKINFDDVHKNYWAWEAIQRAVRFDLVKETNDNKFRPEDNVTRAECLQLVVNSLTTEDLSLAEAKLILAKSYVDANVITEGFIIDAAKAKILGIVVSIPGEEAKLFANRPATRAEVSAFLFNMIEKVKLSPNKKIAEVMQPKIAQGTVIHGVEVQGSIATIPAGTLIPANIDNNLNSQITNIGETFNATINDNLVTEENYLLVPNNSIIAGQLLDKKKAALFVRNGKLNLVSKSIQTPNDDQSASLRGVCDSDAPLSFWRKIFKGKVASFNKDDIIFIKLIQPIKIDLTNTWIIE